MTTTMAARLSREFDGKLRLSYAGGADAFNIDKLFTCAPYSWRATPPCTA